MAKAVNISPSETLVTPSKYFQVVGKPIDDQKKNVRYEKPPLEWLRWAEPLRTTDMFFQLR